MAVEPGGLLLVRLLERFIQRVRLPIVAVPGFSVHLSRPTRRSQIMPAKVSRLWMHAPIVL
eukprot:2190991-Pyramimonas_sp.AAC.1